MREGWDEWVVGNGPGSGSGIQYVQNYFRYMVTGDPKWNMLTADVHASCRQATGRPRPSWTQPIRI